MWGQGCGWGGGVWVRGRGGGRRRLRPCPQPPNARPLPFLPPWPCSAAACACCRRRRSSGRSTGPRRRLALAIGARTTGRRRARPDARAFERQRAAVDSARANRRNRSAGRSSRSGASSDAGPPASDPIDPDVATAEELDALPRIGPALAARIVADRDSLGPFGSLEALQRVRGIGPALASGIGPARDVFQRAPSITRRVPSVPAPVKGRCTVAASPLRASSPTRPSSRHGRTRRSPNRSRPPIGSANCSSVKGSSPTEQLTKALARSRGRPGERLGLTLVKLGIVPETERGEDAGAAAPHAGRRPLAVRGRPEAPQADPGRPGDQAPRAAAQARRAHAHRGDRRSHEPRRDRRPQVHHALRHLPGAGRRVHAARRRSRSTTRPATSQMQSLLAGHRAATTTTSRWSRRRSRTPTSACWPRPVDDAPVVKLINAILIDAVKRGRVGHPLRVLRARAARALPHRRRARRRS